MTKLEKEHQKLMSARGTRVELFRNDFGGFFQYYMRHYATHEAADFHFDMIKDLKFKGFRFLEWVMYRESAKTAYTRGYILWCIVYKKKLNIHWKSADIMKATKNARSIANELQANPKILSDFGQLYWEEKKVVKKSSPKQTRLFKMENDVLFTALSTNISVRGDLEDENRPDLIVMDDFENDITKTSVVMTKKVINNIGESISGADTACQFIFLCNYISKHGSVQHLLNLAKDNPDWHVRWKKLVKNGEITWPSRVVWTRDEALEINKNLPEKQWVKSIEQLKRDVGTTRYNQEFLLIPMTDGERIVREEWFSKGRGHFDKSRMRRKGKSFIFDNGDKEYTLSVVTAIDPAISEKETSDDRAIVTAGKIEVDGETYFLILNCVADKWGLARFGQMLKWVRDKFFPIKIGCESNGVQMVFREVFRGLGISTVALNPDTDKVRRMHRNVADMEFGYVLFPDDGSCDDLKEELFGFTGQAGLPDNRVDAFNYAIEMLKKLDISSKVQGTTAQGEEEVPEVF